MAPYKRTTCRRVPVLINLTPEKIYVYSSGGDIAPLEPQKITLPEIQEGVFYVADYNLCRTARVNGRSIKDLVERYSCGKGRDGVIITSLRLYCDREVRIYPAGD